MRCRGLGEEEALGRRSEGGVPVLLGDGIHGLGHEALAGRVDDEIEAAQLVRCALDEGADGSGVGKVAVAPACGEHAEAVSLQAACDRAADAPGAAGDEGCDSLTRGTISSRAQSRATGSVRMATLAFNREEIAARELKPELLEMDGISRASVEAHQAHQGYVAKRNEILAKLGEVDLAAANQVYRRSGR